MEGGAFLHSTEEARSVIVNVQNGRPVYLGDVSSVTDGPEEPADYVYFGTGGASASQPGTYPAVTLAVAKRKGANATDVSQAVLAKIDALRGYVLPTDVQVTVTRNYGQTAKHKSDELLKHLFLATLSVTLLVALALGWRESGVVLLAIPVTLSLTLFIFYAYGYTLNRVTLFALIFSIGILVDDAIVVVENIVRHFRLTENKGRAWSDVAVEAVDEVGNPTILATFRGDRCNFADGVRARLDGAVHAANSRGRVCRNDVLSHHRVRGFSVGGAAFIAWTCRKARGGRTGRQGHAALPPSDVGFDPQRA